MPLHDSNCTGMLCCQMFVERGAHTFRDLDRDGILHPKQLLKGLRYSYPNNEKVFNVQKPNLDNSGKIPLSFCSYNLIDQLESSVTKAWINSIK